MVATVAAARAVVKAVIRAVVEGTEEEEDSASHFLFTSMTSLLLLFRSLCFSPNRWRLPVWWWVSEWRRRRWLLSLPNGRRLHIDLPRIHCPNIPLVSLLNYVPLHSTGTSCSPSQQSPIGPVPSSPSSIVHDDLISSIRHFFGLLFVFLSARLACARFSNYSVSFVFVG